MSNHAEPTDTPAGAPVDVLVSEVCMACLESPVDPRGGVPTSMVYDRQDPYAVALVFHTIEEDVTWFLARDLLLAGIGDPAGDGDVRIWPAVAPDLGAAVVVRLQAPGGRLVLRLGMAELDDFLDRTLALVPLGTESEHIDLDALVAQLLSC